VREATASRATPSTRIARRSGGLRSTLTIGLATLLLACGSEDAAPRDAEVASEAAPAVRDDAAEPAGEARRRGLWVLCEGSRRVLEDPARVEQLVRHARALDVTDLFVQVYRAGRAWYDADLADATPYREIRESTGRDTLALLLERAHEAGLRVHAWVNVLSLHRNPRAPIVEELGPGVVHMDRKGRSLLDYPAYEVPLPDGEWYRMGTPGLYLDPAAPGVADHLAAAFAELVARYPALDGLHLDYIRHPGVLPFVPGARFEVGLDFGYGEASRLRFQRDTGLPPPEPGRMRSPSRWDDWKREQVTRVVARIRERAREERPGLALSAAVIAYADRAYLSLYQDWRGWLERGLLEFAVPMAYTLDDHLLALQAGEFASGPGADRTWVGVGTWLFASRPEGALEQIEIVRRAGAVGDALFSYDAIADAPSLLEALSATARDGGPRGS